MKLIYAFKKYIHAYSQRRQAKVEARLEEYSREVATQLTTWHKQGIESSVVLTMRQTREVSYMCIDKWAQKITLRVNQLLSEPVQNYWKPDLKESSIQTSELLEAGGGYYRPEIILCYKRTIVHEEKTSRKSQAV